MFLWAETRIIDDLEDDTRHSRKDIAEYVFRPPAPVAFFFPTQLRKQQSLGGGGVAAAGPIGSGGRGRCIPVSPHLIADVQELYCADRLDGALSSDARVGRVLRRAILQSRFGADEQRPDSERSLSLARGGLSWGEVGADRAAGVSARCECGWDAKTGNDPTMTDGRDGGMGP